MWKIHQRCLQLRLQLCSAPYLCWQIILKMLRGSLLVHKESSQPIMHGKLIRFSKGSPILPCLLLHVCLQMYTRSISSSSIFFFLLSYRVCFLRVAVLHQKKGQNPIRAHLTRWWAPIIWPMKYELNLQKWTWEHCDEIHTMWEQTQEPCTSFWSVEHVSIFRFW